MSEKDTARNLLETLEGSLELLRDYTSDTQTAALVNADVLPTLLERCAALAAEATGPEPIRSIHHLACTGGTLISKMISAMPNVTLLSEVDPLSRMGLPNRQATPPFRPTDLIFAGRVALRPLDDEIVQSVALAALEEMRSALAERGGLLCLRDHAHSLYCTRADLSERPSLYRLLQRHGANLSIVTVRHPLDSLLSLRQNGWVNYDPDTLEEYAKRYLCFLDDHEGLPVFRYEDFVTSPETVLEQICAMLRLPFEPGAETLLPAIHLSGDSGRSSDVRIAPRPRRPVPDDLRGETEQSMAYQALCKRLGYDL